MSAKTSTARLPYPTPPDRLSDYPTTAAEMAELLDEVASGRSIVVAGRKYQASGEIKVQRIPGFADFGNVYAATLYLDPPFTPPEGYYFQVFVRESSGFTIVQNSLAKLTNEGKISARVIQAGSKSDTALESVGWRLLKI